VAIFPSDCHCEGSRSDEAISHLCHPDRNVVECPAFFGIPPTLDNQMRWRERDPFYNNQTVKQGIPRLHAFSLGITLGMTERRQL
jgi:hypothetical protein